MTTYGAGLVQGHVMSEGSGFYLDKDDNLQGHHDNMLALGLMVSGLVTARGSLDDDDTPLELIQDKENMYLMGMFCTHETAKILYKDLGEMLNQMEE